MAALRRNLHLFIFSDNVPIADEIALKQEALRRGLLCMGPDQGTAYLGGVGLGFANVVARGRVGCVAASGTGLQAVVSRLDALGEGVSHAIGVGGRDLSEAVGGAMTLFALDALAADPATEAHRAGLQAAASVGARPGRGEARRHRASRRWSAAWARSRAAAGKVVWVDTLQQAADAIVALLAGKRHGQRAAQRRGAQVGSACARSQVRARRPAASSACTRAARSPTKPGTSCAGAFGDDHPHRILDLGDDEYTVGRPHPMIDPRTRGEMIVRAGERSRRSACCSSTSCWARVPTRTPRRRWPRRCARRAGSRARTVGDIAVLAAVIGTARDPQGLAVADGAAAGGGHRDARDQCRRRALRGDAGRARLRAEWMREVA